MAALDADSAGQFAALGVKVDPDLVETGGATIEVWDVNWRAVGIFVACRTQWRVLVLPRRLAHVGLDYPAVDTVMTRLLPADADASAVFADLQVMEGAALAILNEAAS